MKINKKNVLASFSKCDERTQDMLQNVVTQLLKQEKEPNDYALVILQMLAIQYDIFFRSYDALENTNLTTVAIVGEREIHQAKPQLDMLQKAHTQIIKLLDKLAISPLEHAKVKKLNTAEENDNNTGTKILGTLGIL